MAKVIVSKRSYYILLSIFYSLILSGLVWQITQISVNFFKFEIVSDIKVIMPEKENLPKYFNLCFVNYEVIDNDRYEKYCKARHVKPNESNFNYEIPVKDRFNITQHKVSEFGYDVIRYIRNVLICYHGNITRSYATIVKSLLPNVKVMGASFSQVYPMIDFERFQFLPETNQINQSSAQLLSSNVYTMKRLQFPYTDTCIKYQYTQRASYSKCMNEKTTARSEKLYQDVTIAENEGLDFLNMTIISESYKIHDTKCDEILLHPNCYENSIFTYFNPGPAVFGTDEIKLVLVGDENTLPSFWIESKPRIDNIDYVTYIFGALGSWIGFSFIQLNRVGIFFQRQDIAVSNPDTNDLPVTRNRVIKLEQLTKLKLNKCNHDIATMKHTLDQIIQHLNEMQN